MQDIVSQFWGEMKSKVDISRLVKNIFDTNIKPPSKFITIDFWVIGPSDKDEKNLYVTGFITENTISDWPKRGTIVYAIDKIIQGEFPNQIYVHTKKLGAKDWIFCDVNKTASRYARTMDMLIRGCFSDVWPLNSNAISDSIADIVGEVDES